MSNNKIYLNMDEKELVNDLKLAVLEILFEKKDGTNRLMRCTLQPSYFSKPYLNEQQRAEHANFMAHGEAEPDKIRVLHVWDVEQKDWRSFRIDRVLSCQLTAG